MQFGVKEPLVLAIALHYLNSFLHLLPQVIQHVEAESIRPIVRSIATSFDSDPEKGTEGKIGKYLALVNYHSNPITSAMFITATAPNPLVVELIAKATNSQIHLSWTTWALAMVLPGVVALAFMPIALYFMYPPEIKKNTKCCTNLPKTVYKKWVPLPYMK